MASRVSVKIIVGVFFILAALAITGLVAEIAFTASDKFPIEGIEYSPTEIWHWRKNLKIKGWSEEAGNFPLRTDKNGFRNCGKSYDPNSDVVRILIIGDSYTIGLAYPDDKIFTSLLEEQLNTSGISSKKVEVFNMASPAWGTEQQFMCLKNYGLGIKPDYLLLMTCPNDIRETYCKRYAELVNGDLHFNSLPFTTEEITKWKCSNYSCVYQFLQKEVLHTHYGTFAMLNEKFKFNFGKEDETNWDRPMFLKTRFTELEEAWNLYGKFLQEIRENCAKQGIKFAVSSTPFVIEFDDTMKQDTATQAGMVARQIEEYCQKISVPYLNIAPYFNQTGNPQSCFLKSDQHFSLAGHEVTAKALKSYYEKEITTNNQTPIK